MPTNTVARCLDDPSAGRSHAEYFAGKQGSELWQCILGNKLSALPSVAFQDDARFGFEDAHADSD